MFRTLQVTTIFRFVVRKLSGYIYKTGRVSAREAGDPAKTPPNELVVKNTHQVSAGVDKRGRGFCLTILGKVYLVIGVR